MKQAEWTLTSVVKDWLNFSVEFHHKALQGLLFLFFRHSFLLEEITWEGTSTSQVTKIAVTEGQLILRVREVSSPSQ